MSKNTHHDGAMRAKFAQIPAATGGPMRHVYPNCQRGAQQTGTRNMLANTDLRQQQQSASASRNVEAVRICPVVRIGRAWRSGAAAGLGMTGALKYNP